MRYRYVKAKSQSTSFRFPSFLTPVLPLFFLILGLILLFSAAGPIVYYQFFLSPQFSDLAKPVADDFLTQRQETPAEILGEAARLDSARQAVLDMSQASNWFPTAPRFLPRPSRITHYTLSIPKLKIKEALVTIGGEDLKKSLIHYEGTAFPGQFGNAVVFGHSTLPQFFSPKNYLSIFSTLPTLEEKDLIFVDFDGVSYRYQVETMIEVGPQDISVLEQDYSDSYLTLITCVPPGTYLRRLVVKARLTNR